MGTVARKPVFMFGDQVMLKPTCSATEASKNLETLQVASLADSE